MNVPHKFTIHRLLYEYAKAGGDDDRAFTLTKRCFLRVAGVARDQLYKISLPGKSTLGDCFQENMTS